MNESTLHLDSVHHNYMKNSQISFACGEGNGQEER